MSRITELAKDLRNQAKQHNTIILTGDILPQSELVTIRSVFLLAEGAYLTIHGVSPDDVPNPSQGTLTVSAGVVALFGQSDIKPTLIFSDDGSGKIQLVFEARLRAGWAFTDSFDTLAIAPFTQVSLSDACFIYSSFAKDCWSPWRDRPQESISLAQGLNFAAWMTLNNSILGGAVELLKDILKTEFSYKGFGPFSPNAAKPYPVTSLALSLSSAEFKITDQLKIGNLSIIFEITEPEHLLQSIGLWLEASMDDPPLAFRVGLSGSTAALGFRAAPRTGKQVTADQIQRKLPGGEQFQEYIPQELKKAFEQCALKNFFITMMVPSGIGFINLSIGTVDKFKWELIKNTLVLENITLDVSALDPFGSGKFTMIRLNAECQLFPKIFQGKFNFTLEIDQIAGKWDIRTIRGSYYGSVALGDIVNAIIGNATGVPEVLYNIRFSDFGVSVTKSGSEYSYSLYGQCDAAFPILGTQLVSSLSVVADYSKPGYQITLKGALLIGMENFILQLDLGKTGGKAPTSIELSAAWKVTEKNYLKFADIVDAFGFSDDLPQIPEEFDPKLESASLTYNFSTGNLVIGLTSANFGSAVFAALKNQKKRQFFFGLATGKSIGLTTIPLISNFLPPEDTVAIDKIQVLISSDAIDGTLAGTLNSLIGKDYPQVPSAGMSKGLGFSMSVNFGSTQFPIMLGTGASQPALKAAQPAVATDLPVASGSASPGGLAQSPPTSDGVVWFNVQKTFGPVSIQKIGVRYKDGVLVVLMNMSLTASGLTISLLGFGIGSPISTFDPKFEIQGLDVSYVGGGLQVSGGLVGTIDPVNFVGQLRIDAQGFGLGALGGYTTVENHPSLFLYVALNAPLGGPACFFVTGLAGGFGFNRDLKLPDVSGIATFPLVQMATGQKPKPMKMSGDIGQQVNGVLSSLSDIVAPAVGKYWLAAGIKFTSFQLVNSFALAIVKFGGEFEIDIMGMSTLSIPVGVPVVYAELQLLASFKPKEGFIGVSGQLTPQSYLFAPECHLTGGFAFFLWFSGDHKGDFVITLGGYHPKLPKPAHYPTVPRVAVNWQVSDKLSIKGECYCAITSSAVMMGGRLSATWNSDGISAWFTLQVDFVMFYLPFHYYAKANVDIGATFNVNLKFTRLTITAHVGAALEIWGPEFTGNAIVDLDIISFPIHFGATQRKIETKISWGEFTKKVLSSQSSQDKKQPVKRATAGKVAKAEDDISRSILHFNVAGGLIKQLGEQGKDEIYIVNAETLELTVTTSIPIKESKCGDRLFQGLIKLADKQPAETPNEAFGVGPVDKGDTEFSPIFNVTVEQDKAPSKKPVLQATRVLGKAPKALWQKAACDGNGVPTIANPLQDTTIANVVTGYKMAPIAQPAKKTLPIDLQRLQDTGDPNIQQYAWSAPFVPTADTFKDQTTVEQTIMDKTAQKNRTVMLTALKDFIAPLDTSVDVSDLADPARFDLLAEPQMRLLGEQKASAQ